MSSYLSDSDIEYRTGILFKHFETFSEHRSLIVHKEPLKTILSTGENIYAGYGNSSAPENVTFTPISGVFPVMTIYDKNAKEVFLPDVNLSLPTNRLKIKVTEDARNFIKNGNNVMFEIDGLQFNQVSQETVQNYLGLRFYLFTLTSAT
jgi:hypothetical protein